MSLSDCSVSPVLDIHTPERLSELTSLCKAKLGQIPPYFVGRVDSIWESNKRNLLDCQGILWLHGMGSDVRTLTRNLGLAVGSASGPVPSFYTW